MNALRKIVHESFFCLLVARRMPQSRPGIAQRARLLYLSSVSLASPHSSFRTMASQISTSAATANDDAAASNEAPKFSRAEVENLLGRRFFIAPSFGIYGGVAGLYDYGPPGTAMLSNFVNLWREHFVLHEEMHELDLTVLTPHEVLKASGHADRFCDWMVTDTVTGNIVRADHLVKAVLQERIDAAVAKNVAKADTKAKSKGKQAAEAAAPEYTPAQIEEYSTILARLDNYSGEELGELIKTHDVRSPAGNPVTPPTEFNLMFQTFIGPTKDKLAYLRPETAQGQFVNFNKLLEFNGGRMPFASASIGRSFRNEISPRSGLLRVREFLMAEIEHFVDPADKSHPRFAAVSDFELALLPAETQESGSTKVTRMTAGEAVARKVINNETLGYFLVRVAQFLARCGVHEEKLRFRQHMKCEMAHYACDCWDAELLCSYGWIECVGTADRAAYDLTCHRNATGADLVVREALAEPQQHLVADVCRRKVGQRFRQRARPLEEHILSLSQNELARIQKELECNSRSCTVNVPGQANCNETETISLTQDELTVITKSLTVRELVPSVIEPSFGVGRILYCLLEQCYYARDANDGSAATTAVAPAAAAAAASMVRGVLGLSAALAPYKLLVVPLSGGSQEQATIVRKLAMEARAAGLSTRTDTSGVSIGRRYARSDELGTPYAITVDFDTLKDNSVTLRERDSTQQVRVPLCRAIAVVAEALKASSSATGAEGAAAPWLSLVAEFGLITASKTTE